jgi:hypothetical protein
MKYTPVQIVGKCQQHLDHLPRVLLITSSATARLDCGVRGLLPLVPITSLIFIYPLSSLIIRFVAHAASSST